MKKYSLLWHVFELEDQAHHFLVRYIERIEAYAAADGISQEVIDDIKYSIIEKLYRHETPVTEKQVIEIANSLGEPELMFDDTQDIPQKENFKNYRRNLWAIDREKPLIRWVCYRLAKSLNVQVRVIRLIFIVLTLLHGTSILLYIVLALFVPYKDKKKTTGRIGNILFEVVRIALRLFVISTLLPMVWGSIFGTALLFFTPEVNNQSFAERIPQYMYVTAAAVSLSLLALLIGSIGALLKQRRLNKTLALLAVIIVLAWGLITAGTAYRTFIIVNDTEYTTEQTETIETEAGTWSITVDLRIEGRKKDRSFHDMMPLSFDIIAATGDTVTVHIETVLRWMGDENVQRSSEVLMPVQITGNSSWIYLEVSENFFSANVPFTLVERKVTLAVPVNKEVLLSPSLLRFGRCNDRVFVYSQLEKAFVCKES